MTVFKPVLISEMHITMSEYSIMASLEVDEERCRKHSKRVLLCKPALIIIANMRLKAKRT